MSELLRSFFNTVLSDFGVPSGVKGTLAAMARPNGFHQVPPSIGQESVIRWHWWATKNKVSWDFGVPSQIMSRGLDPYLSQLTERYEAARWNCDIREVQGFFASKSDLAGLQSIDEMVAKSCPEFIQDMSLDGLAKNLAHDEIRIIHGGADHFERYGWDGRVFLANEGGSHHFAAAQYMAIQLGVPVPLSGKLINYRLNPTTTPLLCRDYEIFVMDMKDLYGEFHEQMGTFKAPFAVVHMPPPCSDDFAAIFLPKDVKRSMQVAQLLTEGGFYNLGEHLKHLAKAPANVPPIPVPRAPAPGASRFVHETEGFEEAVPEAPRP